MAKTWRFLPFDEACVRHLTSQLRISPVLAQVLSARGLQSSAAASAFLTSKLNELHDPELLSGVPEAADRIVAAVKNGRRITIYGDYDVDGVTSTSLLWHCLQIAGAKVDYYIPSRLEEGYGLNCDALQKLHDEDPTRIVITVDCGITSVREAELARDLGLELIITDHHTLADTLPPAAGLVHPRMPGGSYPFGDLCGVGVAFKLAWAICSRLGDGKKASPRMREFLLSAISLTAIGTVADVVPLRGENRVLVKYGLQNLRERASIGLRALMSVAGMDEKPSFNSEDIGFSLAPRINAVGRLGQARLAVELLTTENPARALELAKYLDELNKQRQSVERKILKQAREMVEAHPEWQDHGALVLCDPEWHVGVVGIVASRVAEHFSKPTIMLSLNAAEGIGQGSCRSFASFDLHAGLTACSHHLLKFGGHQYAAGLKIETNRIDAFREEFAAYVAENHEVTAGDLEIQVDAEVRLGDLTYQAVQDLDRLGPFGSCNRRPVLAATNVELAAPPQKMGEGERHLSLKIKQYNRTLRAIAFGRGEWADEMAAVDGPLNITFAPTLNNFRGYETVELQLIDWQPAAVTV